MNKEQSKTLHEFSINKDCSIAHCLLLIAYCLFLIAFSSLLFAYCSFLPSLCFFQNKNPPIRRTLLRRLIFNFFLVEEDALFFMDWTGSLLVLFSKVGLVSRDWDLDWFGLVRFGFSMDNN
jgi:hypothetical protein